MLRVLIRRGTKAEWEKANPVLLSGEPGIETDTGNLRIGDGITEFCGLAYYKPKKPILYRIKKLLDIIRQVGIYWNYGVRNGKK